jgi:hypothetical protein
VAYGTRRIKCDFEKKTSLGTIYGKSPADRQQVKTRVKGFRDQQDADEERRGGAKKKRRGIHV